MTIVFHFPDAGSQLTPWLARLRQLLADVSQDVRRYLPLDRLDVLTYASSAVIPELGVNGFAENRHLLHMKVDPKNPNFAARMETAIPALFAHEAHHCIRDAAVGYGRTLRSALISEGLACHFEHEVTGRVPFYGLALTPTQINEMWERMQPHLDTPWYNHAGWFFGLPHERIPPHCGYSVGFAKVGEYLARTAQTASQAVGMPTVEFFS